MNIRRITTLFIIEMAFFGGSISAQQRSGLGDNAALRYWAAFSELQDSGITSDQAKELNLILAGTAPYRDDAYKDLLARNVPALQVMARGASLRNCDWGLDYGLRDNTPVEYARKALELGRLNVLYAFHLNLVGDKEGSARTLAAGLYFSRDVANGGTLFATLVAKDLLVSHFRAVEELHHSHGIDSAQEPELQKAIAQLGSSSLDWQGAVNRELDVLSEPKWQDSLREIRRDYAAALANPSKLPDLEKNISEAPSDLQKLIANPKRVLEEKRDFSNQLQQVRAALQ